MIAMYEQLIDYEQKRVYSLCIYSLPFYVTHLQFCHTILSLHYSLSLSLSLRVDTTFSPPETAKRLTFSRTNHFVISEFGFFLSIRLSLTLQ